MDCFRRRATELHSPLTPILASSCTRAHELRDTPIKVNAVHPGYVQTDMNGGEGEIEVALGAKSSVGMALLDESGPTGTFTHLGAMALT